MSRYREVDLGGVTLLSVKDRVTKVGVAQFGRVATDEAGRAATAALVDRFPDILAGRVLKDAIEAVVTSHRAHRPVLLLAGAHVIKVGVQPFLVPLIERRIVTHVGLHGAGAIHDVEVALFGTTSEDVEANLATGAFGMVRETPEFFHGVAAAARAAGEGLGEALGRALVEAKAGAPHAQHSLLAAAWRAGIPATVHVALGTDTIHAHPRANGADLGETTLRDFRILAHTLLEARGATVLHLGSAVILPEVFLKTLTVAVNLGASLDGLTTVNVDQIQHYRPRMNVLERPTRASGSRGLSLTGHHEVVLPLLCEGILARLSAS